MMGYTTDFEGKFDLDRDLSDEHLRYLLAFSNSRRMHQDGTKLPRDRLREEADLPDIAEYYVGHADPIDEDFMVQWANAGQEETAAVIDFNSPPPSQPGLWCKWVPGRKSIYWNGAEKFYHYVEWLRYIIDHFLRPWGYVLDGEVRWRGEDFSDMGTIVVRDNVVRT